MSPRQRAVHLVAPVLLALSTAGALAVPAHPGARHGWLCDHSWSRDHLPRCIARWQQPVAPAPIPGCAPPTAAATPGPIRTSAAATTAPEPPGVDPTTAPATTPATTSPTTEAPPPILESGTDPLIG